ncbi:MAG: hypothetical protein PVH61_41970 [Candidatus Aminicenantes bacterium]|jgi:hypothetical protein
MITDLHKFEAESLRIALICGGVSKDEIINRSDKIILENDKVDYIFIEISCSGKKPIQDIVSLLLQISNIHEHFNACRRVLGLMAFVCETKPRSLRRFASGLYQIAIENYYELPSDLIFLTGIDEEYGLAASGIYGTIDEVDKRFIKELNSFRSELSTLPGWYSATLHANG